MKKILFLFSSVFILFSCIQENEILSDLINDKQGMETSSSFQAMELRATENSTIYFNNIIPIYRYYSGGNFSDHYFGTEKPGSETLGFPMTIKGKSYGYEHQDFCILKEAEVNTKPLYRHVSFLNDSHKFELSSNTTHYGFTRDKLIGYIYAYAKLGTVPLQEFYDPVSDRYHYVVLEREVDYLQKYTPSVKYKRTIGYVYLGNRSESAENRKHITLQVNQNTSNYGPYRMNFFLTVKIKTATGTYKQENIVYENIKFNGNRGEKQTIKLPENWTVLSGILDIYYEDESFKFKPANHTDLFTPGVIESTYPVAYKTRSRISISNGNGDNVYYNYEYIFDFGIAYYTGI